MINKFKNAVKRAGESVQGFGNDLRKVGKEFQMVGEKSNCPLSLKIFCGIQSPVLRGAGASVSDVGDDIKDISKSIGVIQSTNIQGGHIHVNVPTSSHMTGLSINSDEDGEKYAAEFDCDILGEGAVRYAFKGVLVGKGWRNGDFCVAKVFKKQFADTFSKYRPDIASYQKASHFAEEFNKIRLGVDVQRMIKFPLPLIAQMKGHGAYADVNVSSVLFGMQYVDHNAVVRQDDTRFVLENEYVFIEPFLKGKYIKFNSNCGYENKGASNLLPAFTHWTYEKSNHKFMVCDLQGVMTDTEYRLTDPAIHSAELLYTECLTDCGVVGMQKVLEGHTCTFVCKQLNLPPLNPKGNFVPPPKRTTYNHELTYEQKMRNRKARDTIDEDDN